jgi:hypothetical protein
MGGPGELFAVIIQVAIACIPLGLSLWALLDCARRPAWAWALAGRSQAVWMATILVGILAVPVGLFVSGWYLIRIRADVAGAESGRF